MTIKERYDRFVQYKISKLEEKPLDPPILPDKYKSWNDYALDTKFEFIKTYNFVKCPCCGERISNKKFDEFNKNEYKILEEKRINKGMI